MPEISHLIQDTLIKLLRMNATSIPPKLVELLKDKSKIEADNKNELAAQQLNLILKNLEIGIKQDLPICQDTGMLNIIVQFSSDFQFPHNFKQTIFDAISKATEIIPLRPNTVDPFQHNNTGNNLGNNTPPVYFELTDNIEYLKIIVLNKGGGAENMSRLFMMASSSNVDDIKRNIINLVKEAGGKPCPPIILGIGIGGDATYCMYLAKKALIRPLFSRNGRKEVKNLEDDLLGELNSLNIGVMGLGGSTTCLDVRIEWALRHPASFPVGVIVQCYSHRVSSAVIKKNGSITYIHE